MLNFPPSVRIWLATAPVDLRRSFDGWPPRVRQQLHNDPLSGHVFVFRNSRGDRVKLLYWDEDGYVIVYKRLEIGVFSLAGRSRGAGRASPCVPPSWPCCWTASIGKTQRGRSATTGQPRRQAERAARVEQVERVERAGGIGGPLFSRPLRGTITVCHAS